MMSESILGSSMLAGHWLWRVVIAIAVVPVSRICRRTGYSGWLGLLMLVPMFNLVLLYFIGCADWPADKTGAHNE